MAVAENGFLLVNGIQPNSTVSLDGRSMVTNSSIMVVQLKLGTIHSLGVPQLIQLGPGRRLVFAEWSDGLYSNPSQHSPHRKHEHLTDLHDAIPPHYNL